MAWNRYKTLHVDGHPVKFILLHDPEHRYGGDWTYGWKVTVGENQYGDFRALTDKEKTNSLPTAQLIDQAREVIKKNG